MKVDFLSFLKQLIRIRMNFIEYASTYKKFDFGISIVLNLRKIRTRTVRLKNRVKKIKLTVDNTFMYKVCR